MQLGCDSSVALLYKSATQRARVISEHWLHANGYCLACEQDSLDRENANTKAADFRCAACGHQYELKSFTRRPVNSLVDGAYVSLMTKILAGSAPSLLLLERTEEWHVESLTAVHSVFLTPDVIERRKPLSSTARRAGWVGCNIRLDRIAADGEVAMVASGLVVDRRDVRAQFQRFLPLSDTSASERGWTNLTLRIVRSLSKQYFTLAELYQHEASFASSYPDNNHVRAKIRQQLQLLRRLGVLRFEGGGTYSLVG